VLGALADIVRLEALTAFDHEARLNALAVIAALGRIGQ